jgi:hypothetical protein
MDFPRESLEPVMKLLVFLLESFSKGGFYWQGLWIIPKRDS